MWLLLSPATLSMVRVTIASLLAFAAAWWAVPYAYNWRGLRVVVEFCVLLHLTRHMGYTLGILLLFDVLLLQILLGPLCERCLYVDHDSST